jgi:hypothetical protein
MMRPHRYAIRLAWFAALTLGMAAAVAAHTPEVIFRAYLTRTWWHPAQRDVRGLIARLAPERNGHSPYAGMSQSGGGASLQMARDAYRALFPDQPPVNYDHGSLNWPEPVIAHVRDLARDARAANQVEADELELLRCKVDLRGAKLGDDAALAGVRSCLDSYLARPRPAALASEARGWIARTDFLRGKQASAAKVYLGELASETSNIRRERLLDSLLAIEPSEENLDVYFDTPAHALFIANRITNDRKFDALEAPLVERLEQHRNLFGQSSDSDALAIALMRAATRGGAPRATLRYATQVRAGAPARESAEYNWLLGTARFQEKDYSGAEAAFIKVLRAKDADAEHRRLAGNGLVGAYHELDRPLDQLWAGFEAASVVADAGGGWFEVDFDASYLLDVQLSDSQLEEYLERYASAPAVVFKKSPFELRRESSSPFTRSSLEAVRYELAVRHARREEYADAATLYDELRSPRASRMRRAETLLAATRASGVSPASHMEALYDYAFFLSGNENGIFFNDMLWDRFQTAGFVYRNPDTREPDAATTGTVAALSDDERTRFSQLERRLRDDQEEYWRAYQILNRIVQQAGATPLGRKAAARALFCLRRISTERFGRSQEIRAADIRLSGVLARMPRARE